MDFGSRKLFPHCVDVALHSARGDILESVRGGHEGGDDGWSEEEERGFISGE